MIKKILSIIAAICVSLSLCAFAACANSVNNGNTQDGTQNGNSETDQSGNEGENEQNAAIENGHKIVYVFTADSEVMTMTEKSSMYDYMCALRDDGFLSFEGSDGDYGYYVTSVMGVTSKVVSSTANSYSGWDWAVYTTITELDGVIYSGDETTVVDGVTLHKASYGVSGIPCIEGESYALVYEFSSMSW